MRRIPNFYEPTPEDEHVYRLWVRRLTVFYSVIALVAVLALTLRPHQPANYTAAATKAVASATDAPVSHRSR